MLNCVNPFGRSRSGLQEWHTETDERRQEAILLRKPAKHYSQLEIRRGACGPNEDEVLEMVSA